MIENSDREQRQTDDEQASDRAAIEMPLAARGPGLRRRLGGPGIGQNRDAHPDVTRRERAKRADARNQMRWDDP